jgi:diacylglycerol kinase (ATP)
MRAAAILGLGCSSKNLRAFQAAPDRLGPKIEWLMGMPASADDADIVLLFGGDGTIHRHLGPLVRLGLPVLIVPAGSGNDFARGIGLPRVRDSLAAWKKFCGGQRNIRAIDLGVISEIVDGYLPPTALSQQERGSSRNSVRSPRYFCCVAGVGFDAEVARWANRLPRWLRGNGGYALSLLPVIFRFAPLRVKILQAAENTDPIASAETARSVGWIAISDQPTILAAFANTPTYGGGMKIAPQARMDDGLLDVCVVGAVDRFRLFCLFPTVYSGRHLRIREVQYSQTARLRVETERPMDVYADGEFVCRTPVEIAVQRSVLKIVSL